MISVPTWYNNLTVVVFCDVATLRSYGVIKFILFVSRGPVPAFPLSSVHPKRHASSLLVLFIFVFSF